MICLVLAAGYATRLYPLTENFPKPLLEVKGKTILDWLIEDIESTNAVSQYVIISNHKYIKHFDRWKETKSMAITVLDDGTTSNENRLGAVMDISFAIKKLQIDEDLLVIAGDNMLDFSLKSFTDYFAEKNASCIMRYFESTNERLKNCGVVEVDNDDLILNMEEKPLFPKSNWVTPPFYLYKKNDVRLIDEGIKAGCGTDAPGSFVAWLCKRSRVYAMEMKGKRYDIGNLDSYRQVRQQFGGINA